MIINLKSHSISQAILQRVIDQKCVFCGHANLYEQERMIIAVWISIFRSPDNLWLTNILDKVTMTERMPFCQDCYRRISFSQVKPHKLKGINGN
jgi:hypothetical protein